MTAPETPTPAWGDVIPFMGKSWDEMPDSPTPYYVIAQNGTFIHRRTAQGHGITRSSKQPPRLTKLEPIGFTFDGEPIPASIYAQAVDFFTRIYDAHHTEAEVLITQNQETKAYRLFVPTQRVSHGGVYSIYDPRHIAPGHLVVGTFHSHCDFSPYHSSTDEGDARDMDGIHGTIGFLKSKERPEMALMYALNKTFFHFQIAPNEAGIPTYDKVVDMTDLTAGTAPAWWDQYVLLGTITDTDRDKIAPYADNETWDRFMGRTKKPKITYLPPKTPTPTGSPRPGDNDWASHAARMSALGYVFDVETLTFKYMGHSISRESEEFNSRLRTPNPNYSRVTWIDDDEHLLLPGGPDLLSEANDYWEDVLGKDFIDGLFDSGLFTEEDLDAAINAFPESATTEYWERRFRMKLMRAVSWLRTQGLEVTVSVKDPRPKVLPGQIEAFPELPATTGAH